MRRGGEFEHRWSRGGKENCAAQVSRGCERVVRESRSEGSRANAGERSCACRKRGNGERGAEERGAGNAVTGHRTAPERRTGGLLLIMTASPPVPPRATPRPGPRRRARGGASERRRCGTSGGGSPPAVARSRTAPGSRRRGPGGGAAPRH